MINNEFANLKIFCVIPSFNEEKNIIKVLKDVKPLVDEIVVVDDGSDDRTSDIAEQEEVVVMRQSEQSRAGQDHEDQGHKEPGREELPESWLVQGCDTGQVSLAVPAEKKPGL